MATSEPETSRQDEWDECMCCEDPYLEAQLNALGLCTMCMNARVEFNQDGLPGGRPCCRRYLSELRKQGKRVQLG